MKDAAEAWELAGEISFNNLPIIATKGLPARVIIGKNGGVVKLETYSWEILRSEESWSLKNFNKIKNQNISAYKMLVAEKEIDGEIKEERVDIDIKTRGKELREAYLVDGLSLKIQPVFIINGEDEGKKILFITKAINEQ